MCNNGNMGGDQNYYIIISHKGRISIPLLDFKKVIISNGLQIKWRKVKSLIRTGTFLHH